MFNREDEYLAPRIKCLREKMNVYNLEFNVK